MTKQLQFNESSFMSNFGTDLLANNQARAEAMAQAQQNLLKQFEAMNRSILDSIQRSTGSMSELARRLPECGNPGEAAAAYNDWFIQQMDSMVTESRRFADMWLSLCDTAMRPLQPVQGERQGEAPQVGKEHPEKRAAARA